MGVGAGIEFLTFPAARESCEAKISYFYYIADAQSVHLPLLTHTARLGVWKLQPPAPAGASREQIQLQRGRRQRERGEHKAKELNFYLRGFVRRQSDRWRVECKGKSL